MVKDNATCPRHVSTRRVCEAPALVSELLRSLDTKLGRKVREVLKTDHTALVALGIDPSSYSNPDLFGRDWLAVNLMSKYPLLNLGLNTTDVALGTFRESEVHCRDTNRRLRARYETPTTGISAWSLIHSAKLKIADLLGEFDWNEAEKYFGFTSGATTAKRRTQGDPYHKYSGKPDVTRQSALLAVCAIWHSPRWRTRMQEQFGDDPVNWVNIVQGSRITTVPKNAKTDRVIAVEPCMNMYMQHGVGQVIRRRLKRVGINLDDQTVNQGLARCGSIGDFFATIDLKSASDSISYELVYELLPPCWFKALDMLRCSEGAFASGEVIRYQKFSSMGNGYTFELESLIFWALSEAVTDHYAMGGVRVVVYGDDIIVPKATAGFLIELLAFCGFQTNESKSFVSGPFRESCGKHYFRGVDVTPFYIRKPIKSVDRLYWLANAVRRWSGQATSGDVADPRLFGAWTKIVDRVPKKYRFRIPEGIGDVGLIGTFSECRPKRTTVRDSFLCWKNQSLVDGWKFKRMLLISGHDVVADDEPGLLKALSVIERRTGEISVDGAPLNTVRCDRDKVKRLIDWTSTSQWVDAPYWPVY